MPRIELNNVLVKTMDEILKYVDQFYPGDFLKLLLLIISAFILYFVLQSILDFTNCNMSSGPVPFKGNAFS